MIDPNVSDGSQEPPFSARALMRSMEKELSRKDGTPSDEAQELYYQAMDARTEEEELELLTKALEIDPANIDALLVLLQHLPLSVEEEIEVRRTIVELAEQRLGTEAFEEFAGEFWGFIETRPYMRARGELASTLEQAGHLEEAIVEWEAMLKLNPGDNQGVRYSLLPCYLALKNLDAAARLFAQFDEGAWSTVFAWCRVLERFLAGDIPGAQTALAVARKQNAHTEAYLTGKKAPPDYLPEMYAPGSEDEAVSYLDVLLTAWDSHRRAWLWLQRQPSGRGGQNKRRRS